MTQFIVIATIMVLVGLAWVMLPLLRRRPAAGVDRASTNLQILKDQLADLESERQRGAVSDALYAETKAELERRVIEEVQSSAPNASVSASWHGRIAAAAIAVTVPIAAALIYAQRSDPAAFDPLAQKGVEDAHQMSPAQLEKMIEQLADRLKKEPDNAEGWSMLARSYYFQKRFPEAAQAYKRLVELVPDDAATLADYADALAMAQGRQIAGEPLALIKKALTLEPTQWKALAMAGTEAFDRKDYKAAVDYWERLRGSLPPEAPITKQISNSIAEARQLGGMKPEAEEKPAVAAAPATKGAAPASAQISGVVSLSPKLSASAKPDDTVFIFAHAAQGPKMPLAIIRLQVKDLPAKFALDDSMAMSPEFRMSKFSEIVVGARVAKGGVANAQRGDLEGRSKPVKIGSRDINVLIDSVVQ
ncbi:MAG: c-type cytochrome biogenesis protein CcmI [Gemmatimonadota bacterium]